MTISVDWPGTSAIPYQIYVPKADMTLIQASPTVIYELNLDAFRLILRDLEDDLDGRPWPKTHQHSTEVTLGGLTFARIIEILSPYSVTSENDQYAVNLVGANSNVADVANVNQVSIRPNNSAGLISTPLIEYASFDRGVAYDDTSPYDGTINLVGTRRKPVNNWADLKLIADYRGFKRVYIIGDAELDASVDLSSFVFVGGSDLISSLQIESIPNVENSVFEELSISGTLDGSNQLVGCLVGNLIYMNGHIQDCGISGKVTLGGGADALISGCFTVDPYNPGTVNMGGSGQNVAMPNYSGLMTIENLSGDNFVGIGLLGGRVVLDDTVTGGTIHVSGLGELVDSSGAFIPTGIWNGGVTVINEAMSTSQIGRAVWHVAESTHKAAGTFGLAMQMMRKLLNNEFILRNGKIGNLEVLDDDDSTVYIRADVTDPFGGPVNNPAGTPTHRKRGILV